MLNHYQHHGADLASETTAAIAAPKPVKPLIGTSAGNLPTAAWEAYKVIPTAMGAGKAEEARAGVVDLLDK